MLINYLQLLVLRFELPSALWKCIVYIKRHVWALVYAYDHYLLNFILFSDFSPCMGMGLRANFLDSDVNPYYHVSIRLDPKALPK